MFYVFSKLTSTNHIAYIDFFFLIINTIFLVFRFHGRQIIQPYQDQDPHRQNAPHNRHTPPPPDVVLSSGQS